MANFAYGEALYFVAASAVYRVMIQYLFLKNTSTSDKGSLASPGFKLAQEINKIEVRLTINLILIILVNSFTWIHNSKF
jgi:hypothetical protein